MALTTTPDVAHSQSGQPSRQQALHVLHQAEQLLSRLTAARESSEQRAHETGRVDPMKTVTGRSSIEAAIDRTRRLIREMNELVQAGGTNGSTAVHVCADACNESLRRGASRRVSESAAMLAVSR